MLNAHVICQPPSFIPYSHEYCTVQYQLIIPLEPNRATVPSIYLILFLPYSQIFIPIRHDLAISIFCMITNEPRYVNIILHTESSYTTDALVSHPIPSHRPICAPHQNLTFIYRCPISPSVLVLPPRLYSGQTSATPLSLIQYGTTHYYCYLP